MAPIIDVGLKFPGPPAVFESIYTSPTFFKYSRIYASKKTLDDVAKGFAKVHLGAPEVKVIRKNTVDDPALDRTLIYMKQHIDGIEIANVDIAVDVTKRGWIISYSSNAYKPDRKQKVWSQLLQSEEMAMQQKRGLLTFLRSIKWTFDPRSMVFTRQKNVGGAATFLVTGVPNISKPIKSRQTYIQSDDGVLQLAWEFVIDLGSNYFTVHMSPDGGYILSLTDRVLSATYSAIPVGFSNVADSGGTMLVMDAEMRDASREGWHSSIPMYRDKLWGNNVRSFISTGGLHTQDEVQPVALNGFFDFPYHPNAPLEYNSKAAMVNVFQVLNMWHDIFYRFGFDEKAGNFQHDNFDRGGLDEDAVHVMINVRTVINNAFFTSSPDGERGRMQIGVWHINGRQQDGSFDNDLIIHEMTHGLSTRLVGGAHNEYCLKIDEARGMGEGWSDFVAIWMRMNSNDRDDKEFRVGEYLTQGAGIRKYPYTLDEKKFPMSYTSIRKLWKWQEVHGIGTLWANILYQMYRNIFNAMGGQKSFTYDYKNPRLRNNRQHLLAHSNTYVMQIIVDSMQLMPCNPTFIHGRDALLMADTERSGGKYMCEIYAAFAKWGVGYRAKSEKPKFMPYRLVGSNELPPGCGQYKSKLHDLVAFTVQT
ncbi:Fungalysin metallopeptidase-domain-containing protein [Syncephalis pseudoplumigaleata]|uniref:Extracellular metalloproteinase n=1 Tax=Syncephalis pseudoplumigaleata TaxID=1712513 RepID=A0A4V1J105_9FUNG|nr:Fungalysin metallopeptidase-domain-containing protein [Syncephalis pseudoplumigaleata]|eukprot:RKP23379.1 Fungalysin metallopeptidase-domain-containing protein [Syncephalis pseudoplumigaleata]